MASLATGIRVFISLFLYAMNWIGCVQIPYGKEKCIHGNGNTFAGLKLKGRGGVEKDSRHQSGC